MSKLISLAQIICLVLMFLPLSLAQAQLGSDTSKAERLSAEHERLLKETEAIRLQAERSVEKARMTQAKQRSSQANEMARMREELSLTHRQLREISSEVAQAHRELEQADQLTKHILFTNVGDRAVLGVVLGKESEDGVHIIGVSPDGPAERAGLLQGDVLVSIAGTELNGRVRGGGRKALIEAMQEVSPGTALTIDVLRDGESWQFTVTAEQREPRSWQSVLRLSDSMPHSPGAPRIIVENFDLPEFDEEELAIRIEEINKQAQNFEHLFSGEEGEMADFTGEFEFNEDAFSKIGMHAMREARVWFGLPHTRGLELTTLNPDLGKYFNAERGVLVIQAHEDNSYGLESGDVVQIIANTEVHSPADMLRALREIEPGAAIDLNIKRDGHDHVLQAKNPQNQLGQIPPYLIKRAAVTALPPPAD